jgi:hypothetical protein
LAEIFESKLAGDAKLSQVALADSLDRSQFQQAIAPGNSILIVICLNCFTSSSFQLGRARKIGKSLRQIHRTVL